MIEYMLVCAVIGAPLGAVINRLRGTKEWLLALGLPGHGRFYLAPVVAALSALCNASPWWGLAWLIWSWGPWGFLFSFGRFVPADREISTTEKFLLDLSLGNYFIAFYLRHFLWILPALFVFLPPISAIAVAFVLALEITLSYWLAFKIEKVNAIPLAEIFTGAVWAISIVFSSHLDNYTFLEVPPRTVPSTLVVPT